MRAPVFLLAAFLLAGCETPPRTADRPLRDILFGSCLNKTEHPMLDRTARLPMDLFVFLGDNIYADTTNMMVMRAKYDALKATPFFQTVRRKAPVLATWLLSMIIPFPMGKPGQ